MGPFPPVQQRAPCAARLISLQLLFDSRFSKEVFFRGTPLESAFKTVEAYLDAPFNVKKKLHTTLCGSHNHAEFKAAVNAR